MVVTVDGKKISVVHQHDSKIKLANEGKQQTTSRDFLMVMIVHHFGYVGTLFLYQRCACHIINLIVNSLQGNFWCYVAETLLDVYYPTSPLIMHNILDIIQHLNHSTI
ncbi:hypothetical protein ACJX0J_039527 [Zea mays]